jgi:VCBS repeat protein
VLLGNGDGTFAAKVDLAGGGDLSFVAAADLNRDGKPDLAVANGVGMSVLLGNGDGSFGALTAGGTANLPLSVAVADLNRDGKPDLAAPNFLDANSISVALGNGDGTFGPTKTYTIATRGCGQGGHTTFCNPVSLAAGDLNGDGRPDLVASAQGAGGVLVLPGTGNGAFGAPTTYPGGAYSVAIADLNRDGKPDLATGGGNVSVLLNRPPVTRIVGFSAKRLTWTAAGFVRLPLANPNPFAVIGSVKITTAFPVALPGARPGAKKRFRTIAKDVFWIPARKSVSLRLALTQVGRNLLAQRKRRSVRVTLTTQGPTGAPTAGSKVVPLEPAKPAL